MNAPVRFPTIPAAVAGLLATQEERMTLTVPAGELAGAVRALATVTQSTAVIPILNCARIIASQAGAIIEGTDLDRRLVVGLPGAVATEGFACALNLKALAAAVKPAEPGDLIVLRAPTRAGEAAEIAVRSMSIGVETRDVGDFPNIFAEPGTRRECVFPAADLRRALGDCMAAVSTEATRYYLNGVYLHPNILSPGGEPEAVLVATDGHKLVRHIMAAPAGFADKVLAAWERQKAASEAYQEAYGAAMEGASVDRLREARDGAQRAREAVEEAKAGVIIPRMTCGALLRTMLRKPTRKAPDEGGVIVRISDKDIEFEAGPFRLTSKLIDGTFPDYTRVLPNMPASDARVAFTVVPSEIAGAAKTLAATAAAAVGRKEIGAFRIGKTADQITASIRYTMSNNGTEAPGSPRWAKVEASLPSAAPVADAKPGDWEIGFNPDYVALLTGDLLKDCPAVRVIAGDPGAPAEIVGLDASGQPLPSPYVVLMPMRV